MSIIIKGDGGEINIKIESELDNFIQSSIGKPVNDLDGNQIGEITKMEIVDNRIKYEAKLYPRVKSVFD